MTAPLREHRKETPVFWRGADLPFEARRAFDSTACYREHTHSTLSVGIVDQGRSLLNLSRRQLPLSAGDVVIIWPGQVHACNPESSSRWSYRMFYLDWDWVLSTVPLLSRLARDMAGQQVMRTPAGAELVDQMTDVLTVPASSPEKVRRMSDCLTQLYHLAIQRPTDVAKSFPPSESWTIGRARNYIEAHASEAIALDQLAIRAGLTRFQFIRKFRREVGLTPHAYQLDRRIIHAKELLRGPHSVVDIACRLGFSDQSHFQRAFKTRAAATPGQYRAGQQI